VAPTSFPADGVTGVTVTDSSACVVAPKLSVTWYTTGVAGPVKAGSGSKLASPVAGSIVQVPSPATTSVRPELVAAAEVNTRLAGSRVPVPPAPSSPAVSFASGCRVTSTFCGVVAWSSDATDGAPTVIVSVADASVPSRSATW